MWLLQGGKFLRLHGWQISVPMLLNDCKFNDISGRLAKDPGVSVIIKTWLEINTSLKHCRRWRLGVSTSIMLKIFIS